MPKGRQKKIINERIHFIHNELENRMQQLRSLRTDTKEQCQKAIKMLERDIKFSANLTIPL